MQAPLVRTVLENRCRMIKEITQGIKEACGKDFPVIVRLSVEEFYQDTSHPDVGYHLDEGVRIAKEIETYGIDGIDVSIAGYDSIYMVSETLKYPPQWRNYMNKTVREAVSVPVLGVSVIRTPEQAEENLKKGVQDFVCLARPQLADPTWANKAKEGLRKRLTAVLAA